MAFEIKTGDTKPWFVVVLKDNFGEANEAIVNLTTASTAVFNMTAMSPGTKVISRAGARITNAAGGEVTYCWGTNGAGTQDTSGARARGRSGAGPSARDPAR